MLLQDVAHKRFWWIGGSDQRLPGVLEYSPERGSRLTLNGTFESQTFRSFGGAEVRHEIILGTTSLGKHITLVDCLVLTSFLALSSQPATPSGVKACGPSAAVTPSQPPICTPSSALNETRVTGAPDPRTKRRISLGRTDRASRRSAHVIRS